MSAGLTDQAIALLVQRHWPMVPSAGKEKRPCVKWKEFQKRLPTIEELRQWDRQFHPERWGPVTGRLGGIVVADFDGDMGRILMDQWGIKPDVQSGSGGFHKYLQHPGWRVPTLNAKSSKVTWPWPGLDMRGDGGFAVLLGRNQNGPYVQLRELRPAPFEILPAAVREFLRRDGVPPRVRTSDGRGKERRDPGCDNGAASDRVGSERMIRMALEQVPGSGRNNAGIWLACQLRDNGYSIAEAEGAMRDYLSRVPGTNTKGEREPYTEQEMRASLHEAYSRPAREPWGQGKQRAGPRPVRAPSAPEPPISPEPRLVSMRKPAAGLPRICANGRQLRDISNDALAALQAANNPLELFSRGNVIVAIILDEKSRKIIAPVGESALRGRLARSADYYKVTAKGDPYDCAPPIDAVKDILALQPAGWEFPSLEGLVEAPVLRPDGTILDRPGYDPSTGLYYAPDPDLRIPEIPMHPTRDQIDVALSLITDDVLVDFPFIDEASKANAIAGMLSPIVKSAINAPTPLQLNDAPQSGTGKSLGAEVVSIISTGRPAEMFSAPKDEDEWRKQITTALLSGTSVVVFDNISRRLDSGELCKALTATQYADREFRTHEKILLPVSAIFIATGNNVQLGGDIPRRCYHVRLDAKHTRPFLRTGFKHPDLTAWVMEHRGELLAALLTLARAWYVAGKPKTSMTPLGGFEAWSITIGGILEHAGVNGFLGNAISLYEAADQESMQWERFLLTVHDSFGNEPFTTAQIMEKLHEKTVIERANELRAALPDFLAEAMYKEGFFQRRTGKCFAERLGKRFGESGAHLKRGSILNGRQQWEVSFAEGAF